MLKDGLYRVEYSGNLSICAGFVVSGGVVVRCAPILRGKLEWWIKRATLIENGAAVK
jgi:hypothetical protein